MYIYIYSHYKAIEPGCTCTYSSAGSAHAVVRTLTLTHHPYGTWEHASLHPHWKGRHSPPGRKRPRATACDPRPEPPSRPSRSKPSCHLCGHGPATKHGPVANAVNTLPGPSTRNRQHVALHGLFWSFHVISCLGCSFARGQMRPGLKLLQTAPDA